MKTIIIAVIPGTIVYPDVDIMDTKKPKVVDLTKPEFLNLESYLSPTRILEGYLEEIQNNIGECDYLVIDGIPSLLKELEKNYLSYVLAIPKPEQRLKWVGSLYITQRTHPEIDALVVSMHDNFEKLFNVYGRKQLNSSLNPCMVSYLSDCYLSSDNFYIWSTTSGNRK